MHRTHLRGHANILKRLLVHIGRFNLGLFMLTLVGAGTPRSLQRDVAEVLARIIAFWMHVVGQWCDPGTASADPVAPFTPLRHFVFVPVGA